MSGSFNNFPAAATTPSQQEAAAGLAGNAFMSVVGLNDDPAALTPSAGDWYAIDNGSVGEWTGHDGQVTCWDGTQWVYYPAIPGLIVYPQNATSYIVTNGTSWNPWFSSSVPAKLSLNGASGGAQTPSSSDHSHPNYATAAGDAFGDPTLAWQFRLGGILGGMTTISSGGTYTLDLAVNGSIITFIWVLATAGNGTLNLPAATEKRIVFVAMVITGANTFTVHPAGTDTLNGAAADLVLGVAANSTGRILTCNGSGAWSFVG